MAHLQGAPARLAHDREGFGERRFQRLSAADPLAQGPDPRAELRVGERDDLRLQRIDALDGFAHPA